MRSKLFLCVDHKTLRITKHIGGSSVLHHNMGQDIHHSGVVQPRLAGYAPCEAVPLGQAAVSRREPRVSSLVRVSSQSLGESLESRSPHCWGHPQEMPLRSYPNAEAVAIRPQLE